MLDTMEIEIEILGKGKVKATLDNRNPVTSRTFYESLPLEGNSLVWQDEIYFSIPFRMEYENSSPISEQGDISYWPLGHAFCIFFGDSQPASPVNHIGIIKDKLEVLREVRAGEKVIVRRL